MLRSDFIANVQNFMDAEQSNRWSPSLITQVGDVVFSSEWSEIMNQNRFYRLNMAVPVTTDANGQVLIANLSTGSGDTKQYFYRVLTGFTDGNMLWRETDLDVVPLATTTNNTIPNDYRFYLAGDSFQLLPVQSGLNLTVAVNHIPPSITQLASDASTITFPFPYEWILVWVTAATLLMKGAAESQAASDLFALASSARKNLLGDIGRLTTRPTFMRFPDSSADWSGSGY